MRVAKDLPLTDNDTVKNRMQTALEKRAKCHHTTLKGIESKWKYAVQNARRKHLNEMDLPVMGNKTTAA